MVSLSFEISFSVATEQHQYLVEDFDELKICLEGNNDNSEIVAIDLWKKTGDESETKNIYYSEDLEICLNKH